MGDFAERLSSMSRERLMLLALGLRDRLEESTRRGREPIAVVGLGCRFPGAGNPDEFWQLLRAGRDAITPIPADRFDAERYYSADPDSPGKMYTREGGFVPGIDLFDPHYFGIAPREAEEMDPQQRLLLEVACEALESAGLVPTNLAGTPTGVFVGLSTFDYQQLACRFGSLDRINAYTGTGCAHNTAAGRLSYVLGLSGPNFPVDTACSSALVAVHLACQSLRNNECRLALAGGVNALLAPDPFIYFCKVRALSPDGRCKTFDASANGYGRGEGCGLVVLKRLADARQDNDRILAVILGSAVNHDGRSNGLTVPNGAAQEAVIRAALANAGIQPGEVDYLEAHGTGTPLGDPIELQAANAVLGRGRPRDRPLLVGSVKTNVGHLEAAAGIAGLIKVILSLQHGEVPPHLHFHRPNPFVAWDEMPLAIPTKVRAWPAGAGPRRAGVSSFGFSGTNAHVVVEAAPVTETQSAGADTGSPWHLLPLSAPSAEALRAVGQSYRLFLAGPGAGEDVELADFCASAARLRSHHEWRCGIVADSKATALQRLDAFLADELPPCLAGGRQPARQAPRVAFLFTGQGSQYVRMGRQAYEALPVFRQTLDRCDEILKPLLNRSLLSVLYPDQDDSPLHETTFTQVALFSLEYALAQQWQAWGVKPAAVLGHSVGEYVAACVAGVFALEDGLKLVAGRARLMGQLPRDGAMASVFADEETVRAAVAEHGEWLAVAALNGPEHTVLSGERAALEAVLARLEGKQVAAQRLTVSHAFHSPLLDPIVRPFEDVAGRVKYSSPGIGLISNLTGQPIRNGEIDAGYWSRHLRQPVQFAAGMQTLHRLGYEVFVEVGPHPVLSGMAKQCLPAGVGTWLPSLARGSDDCRQLLESLSALYARGADVNWPALYPSPPCRRISLPPYPYQRERLWWDQSERARSAAPTAETVPPPTPPSRQRRSAPAAHPLLGERLRLPAPAYESSLPAQDVAWLGEHRLFDLPLVPGSAWLEMAVAAARAEQHAETVGLREVRFEQLLLLSAERPRCVQLLLTPEEGGTAFRIFSLPEEAGPAAGWTLHARGRITPGERLLMGATPLSDLRIRLRESVPRDAFYERLRQRGLQYGPAFQSVEQLFRRDREALGKLRLSSALSQAPGAYHVHPALLDGALQLVEAALPASLRQDESSPSYVPTGVAGLCCYRSLPACCWGHVVLRRLEQGSLEADLRLLEESGKVVVELAGLRLEAFRSLPTGADEEAPAARTPADPMSPAPAPAPGGTAALTRDTLLAVAPRQRQGLLQAYLRSHLAAILGMAETRLDGDAPLRRLGLDSLMTYRLALRLERSFGVNIDMRNLDGELSVAALAALLLGRINGGPEAS